MIYGFNAGEVFKIAIEIEENGRLFYEKAQAKAGHPLVVEIFQELGVEEAKHKALFTEMLKALPEAAKTSTVWDPDNELDQYLKMMSDMHVFRKSESVENLVASLGSPQAALKLAMDFEKDSIVFFAEMQTLSEDEEARRDIGRLVREEQQHLKRLALQLRKLG